MEARVTLAEAIRELRTQLVEAQKDADDAPVRFIAKSVEVELGITFKLEAEGGGGLKLFSLVDVSAKTKGGDEASHKIRLTLEPVDVHNGPVSIRDRDRLK